MSGFYKKNSNAENKIMNIPTVFPIDQKTGWFVSDAAESAYRTAKEMGIDLDREEMRAILRAFTRSLDEGLVGENNKTRDRETI